MRTANPALNKKTFVNLPSYNNNEAMSIDGTVNKTLILLALLLLPAIYMWSSVYEAFDNPEITSNFTLILIAGVIIGLIFALITIFKKEWAPVTAPIYVLAEGLVLGTLSAIMEKAFPGIVIQAVALTFGTLFILLFAYKSRLIKVTQNFRLGIVAATGGIAMIYLLSFVMGFFGVGIPYIHESGLIGIGFSLFVVVIAALNLVLDFDFIERGAKHGAPKYMEWYAAFGLMVTLIWLYLEILRLLAKIRSRK